jgi:hypothetical protein
LAGQRRPAIIEGIHQRLHLDSAPVVDVMGCEIDAERAAADGGTCGCVAEQTQSDQKHEDAETGSGPNSAADVILMAVSHTRSLPKDRAFSKHPSSTRQASSTRSCREERNQLRVEVCEIYSILGFSPAERLRRSERPVE